MRWVGIAILTVLVAGLAYCAWAWRPASRPAGPDGSPATAQGVHAAPDPVPTPPTTRPHHRALPRFDEPVLASLPPVPVASNRGANVRDGFRGQVHPLLHGSTPLEVSAYWTRIGKGRDGLERTVNAEIYSWFTALTPAEPRRTYDPADFSVFLPQAVGEVGQVWSLDPDRVAVFLAQFHPRPSLHLVARGRRGGPDGAFALLRAVSPSYLDIAFRIHAEFFITPDDRAPVPVAAWYTPAYFAGRLLVNRQAGTVDCFQLALPTDKALNVHLTVDASALGYGGQAHDIVRVERMELTGGDARLADRVAWDKALTPAEAQRRLAKVFYKFLDIDWVPLEQALAEARRRDRPIFAVVSWGSFDDQSC
jgi:hypothetical protein